MESIATGHQLSLNKTCYRLQAVFYLPFNIIIQYVFFWACLNNWNSWSDELIYFNCSPLINSNWMSRLIAAKFYSNHFWVFTWTLATFDISSFSTADNVIHSTNFKITKHKVLVVKCFKMSELKTKIGNILEICWVFTIWILIDFLSLF